MIRSAAEAKEEVTETLQNVAADSSLEVGDRIILRFLDRENSKPEFFVIA